jgi:dihydropyrimidine dehydrogenase (NAD+) subunit PreT
MNLHQQNGDTLAEQLPPFSEHEALVEANRCLYCYDAPCTHACPTHIDIPRFIKKIATGNLAGSARTILDANLLGATCARVCPVQELCEGACVLGSEHKPISIGRLQRHAMDDFYARGALPFTPLAATSKRIAVVGAGPAGASCAGELAKRGHAVTIFEKRPLAGGLSTYGIISLREPIDIALAEVELLKRVGVEVKIGVELCRDLKLPDLQSQFDAVFLSAGQGAAPALGIPGDSQILDGLTYIEQSKLSPHTMHIGRNVIVVGAGNTAIDCATIARRLGAPSVTIVYRRSESEMSAYRHEYEFAKNEGIAFRFYTQPVGVIADNGGVSGLQCVSTQSSVDRRIAPQPIPGSEFVLPTDQVVKAIGQERPSLAALLGLQTNRGFIAVDSDFETSVPGVYAGGDGVRAQGNCSTVMAVEDGKLAALSIHKKLMEVS